MKSRTLASIFLLSRILHGQDRPPPIVSPEVHADRSVTFRLRAPQAREVSVSGEWGEGRPLVKDDAGVWSVTLGPMAPDLYGYGFSVDGLRVLDPSNTAIKPMRSNSTSILDVPGAKPSPCDPKAGVPRGTVHLHDYESKSLGRTRRLRVYTPASYDADKEARFPVLYLLHGSGDNEATWTELGRAHVILDNLTAEGKAKPMVVVMTDGHAVAPGAANARGQNLPSYERDLLEEVMPFVEASLPLAAGSRGSGHRRPFHGRSAVAHDRPEPPRPLRLGRRHEQRRARAGKDVWHHSFPPPRPAPHDPNCSGSLAARTTSCSRTTSDSTRS